MFSCLDFWEISETEFVRLPGEADSMLEDDDSQSTYSSHSQNTNATQESEMEDFDDGWYDINYMSVFK